MSDNVEVEGDTPDTAANTNGEGAEASLLLQSPSVESPINSGSEYEEISLITSRYVGTYISHVKINARGSSI